MDWLWNALWFVGLWMCGTFVFSVFGMQIGIILRCTNKIMKRIVNNTEYWDSGACKRYLNGVIFKNLIIILALSAIVIYFCPSFGIGGYLISMVFNLIISFGAMGLTRPNMEESCEIFLRFARPHMREEMAELLPMLVQQMLFESVLTRK